MCLAIPGRVTAVFEENGIRMGDIDFAGTLVRACLEYVPEIMVGQYTVVHAGFAISVLDEDEAMKSHAAWRELIDRSAEQGMDIYGNPLARDGEE